jgi:hypothetical protein
VHSVLTEFRNDSSEDTETLEKPETKEASKKRTFTQSEDTEEGEVVIAKKAKRDSVGTIAECAVLTLHLSFVRADGSALLPKDIYNMLKEVGFNDGLIGKIQLQSSTRVPITNVLNVPFEKTEEQLRIVRAILANKRVTNPQTNIVLLSCPVTRDSMDFKPAISLIPLSWRGINGKVEMLAKMMFDTGISKVRTPITNVAYSKKRDSTQFKLWDPIVRMAAVKAGSNLSEPHTSISPIAFPLYGDDYSLEMEGETLKEDTTNNASLSAWLRKVATKVEVGVDFAVANITDPDWNKPIGRAFLCFSSTRDTTEFLEKTMELLKDKGLSIKRTEKRLMVVTKTKEEKKEDLKEESEEDISPYIAPPSNEKLKEATRRTRGRGRGKGRGRGRGK